MNFDFVTTNQLMVSRDDHLTMYMVTDHFRHCQDHSDAVETWREQFNAGDENAAFHFLAGLEEASKSVPEGWRDLRGADLIRTAKSQLEQFHLEIRETIYH